MQPALANEIAPIAEHRSTDQPGRLSLHVPVKLEEHFGATFFLVFS
jgi:hypothetical protein